VEDRSPRAVTSEESRSRVWKDNSHPRYWWHHLPGIDYVPPIYSELSEAEWVTLREWYDETDRSGPIGECAVPLISFLHGLVMGNRIGRIVQLGTCAGYSTLLLGWMLRRMNARNGLFSLDHDPAMCEMSRRWIVRADLEDFVEIVERSSLDAGSTTAARNYLGGEPELIILDSSTNISLLWQNSIFGMRRSHQADFSFFTMSAVSPRNSMSHAKAASGGRLPNGGKCILTWKRFR